VNRDAAELIRAGEGLATTAHLLTAMTRQELDVQVRKGNLIRVWRGVYSVAEPDLLMRLRALDLLIGGHAVACLHTAATLYGFGIEESHSVHVHDPGVRLRPTTGLVVHQRQGAPIQLVSSRRATTPAWTAVELAREARRPRALAILDAAVHSSWCTPADLADAVDRQRGRRGIVKVRDLLRLVDGRAESAMESEARLAMLDGGLPRPELQYLIHGRDSEVWRVDFAWPWARVAAEYESVAWHAGRIEMERDKSRFAGVQDTGWIVVPIVVADVRRAPGRMCERIQRHLDRAAA
jgi:very-short-patch-repair endonuclease